MPISILVSQGRDKPFNQKRLTSNCFQMTATLEGKHLPRDRSKLNLVDVTGRVSYIDTRRSGGLFIGFTYIKVI